MTQEHVNHVREQKVEGGKEEEEEILFFDEEDMRSRVEDCLRSLVGGLFAIKSFSIRTMEIALRAIWDQLEGFYVMTLDNNVYQFFIAKEVDVLCVEIGSSWLIKNHVLHLWRWKEGLKIEEKELLHFPV